MVENNLGEHLLKVRKSLKMTQGEVAKALDISTDYVSKIEKGTHIPKSHIKAAIERWLSKNSNLDAREESLTCVTVDIYSMVEAGVGAEPEWHEPVDRQAIPSKLLRVSIKPVLVRGRSMEPSIMDGAIIGVDLQDKQVVEGEVYAIMLPYVGAAVKRLYPLPDGVLIRSDNKEFPEVKIRREEIQDHFILGKVKWVLQEF